MKELRKSILCFLSATALLCSCAFSGYIFAADANAETAYRAMELLRTLEIIPDHYEYNTDLTEPVTRGDFVNSAVKLINQAYGGGEIYYYDVPSTHWAYDAIGLLTETGVLNGSGNKYFYPDENIKTTDACKILLSILGYGRYAEEKGGYPSGYILAAQDTNLTKSVSKADELTIGNMFILLENALNIDMFRGTVFGKNGAVTFEAAEGETLLKLYRSIYKDKGILTGAACINTEDGSSLRDGIVLIDGEEYTADIDLADYLGEELEFYYYAVDEYKEKEIIIAYSDNGSDVLKITVDRDASFDSESFVLSYYDENQKAKKVELDRGINVIYNGGLVESGFSDIFNKPRYELKLVKGANGKYQTAIIKAYEVFVIGTIDLNNNAFYEKTDTSRKIELDKALYKRMEIKKSGGLKISPENLEVNQVLNVFRSKDNNYLEIYVTASQVEGAISAIRSDGYGEYLTVKDAEYYVANESKTTAYGVGKQVILYLDYFGDAAYTELKAQDMTAGYLIDVSAGEPKGLDTAFKLKMLTESNEIAVFECDKKLKVDGITYEKLSEKRALFTDSDGNVKRQLILVKTDDDGRIYLIDTANVVENEASLRKRVINSIDNRYYSAGSLGPEMFINNDTKIFAVPTDASVQDGTAKESEYSVIARSTMTQDETLDVEAYATKERVGYEQYIVVKRNETDIVTYDSPVLVSKVIDVLNDDGQAAECLKGYKQGNAIDLIAASGVSFKAEGIKEGAVVRPTLNAAGEVMRIEVLCTPDDISEKVTEKDILSKRYKQIFGKVNDVVDTVIKIDCTMPDDADKATGENVDFVFDGSKAVALVYDSSMPEGKRVAVGTVNEALTYLNEGANCSYLFTVTNWTIPFVYVIYK